MNPVTYIRRVVKYAIYLALLASAIYLLMSQFNKNVDFIAILSDRGLWLGAALLFFSLLHPFMGYSSKLLTCNATKRKDEVVNVMAKCGYRLVEDKDDIMTFRVEGKLRSLMLLGEDAITIDNSDDGISTMRGPRREVVKASFRIGTFVS